MAAKEQNVSMTVAAAIESISIYDLIYSIDIACCWTLDLSSCCDLRQKQKQTLSYKTVDRSVSFTVLLVNYVNYRQAAYLYNCS